MTRSWSRNLFAAVVAACLLATSCGVQEERAEALDDVVVLAVGDVEVERVFDNDFATDGARFVRVEEARSAVASVRAVVDGIEVTGLSPGTASFEYSIESGNGESTARLIVEVSPVAVRPVPVRPVPVTPVPVRPVPVTPVPVTPDPGCRDGEIQTTDGCVIAVEFSCRTVPQTSLYAGEYFDMIADYTPSNVTIAIDFHHGDGTVESGADRQSGFFRTPGTYTVRAEWRTEHQQGSAQCGVLRVGPAPVTCGSDEIETPGGCEKRRTATCTPTSRSVVVGELFDVVVSLSPAAELVAVDLYDDSGDPMVSLTEGPFRYDHAGAFSVGAIWRTANQQGDASCGIITVQPACDAELEIEIGGICYRRVLDFDCTVSTASAHAGSPITISTSYSPADLFITVNFDIGDGTPIFHYVDQGDPALFAWAEVQYDIEGTYAVVAYWVTAAESGAAGCGKVSISDYYG